MYKTVVEVRTGAGTTGAVNASSTAAGGLNLKGKLHSVYFDYGSVTSVTNVTLATDLGTIFTVSNNASDGRWWPRAVLATSGGTDMSTASLRGKWAIESWMRVSVSSSTPSTLALTAHLFIEE